MNEFERIAKVIHFLDRHHTEQPALETIAAQAGLSPSISTGFSPAGPASRPKTSSSASPSPMPNNSSTRVKASLTPLSKPAFPDPAGSTIFASASKPPRREKSKLPAPIGPSTQASPTAPSDTASSPKAPAASAISPSSTQSTVPQPKPPFTMIGPSLGSAGTTRQRSDSPRNSLPSPQTDTGPLLSERSFAAAPFKFESGGPY